MSWSAIGVGENMQGLMAFWRALPVAKRLILVGAVAGTIAAFSFLAKTATSPTMALLYSGLEPSAAGDVVAALEQMNIQLDVRGNAIYVPSGQRDFARMALAREGLPRLGQAGYELFEDLNVFSTNSDIFNVTYWRAVEGELARTILATPGVQGARVHIAHSRNNSISRNSPEPKAVVTVTMGRGSLNTSQAQSIRYLVASSVPELSAQRVAVLDSDKGVILSPGNTDANAHSQSNANERERKMEADLLDLLEARVGEGNARVQIALEIDTERETVSERVLDPEGRVATGKETTEMSETSNGSNGGAVSVASNLPEGDETTTQSSTERTQTDETIKYDVSEIRREREKAPGAIRRLSVAVLVNQIDSEAAGGSGGPTPRSEQELGALRELVASAVGFDETRGDTLTIQSMPFKPIGNQGVSVTRSPVGDFVGQHIMTMVQIGVLSAVTLILGLFVVKPVLSGKNIEALTTHAASGAQAGDEPATLVAQTPDAVETLRGLATEKTDETATLIKSWLEEENAA